MPGFASVLLSVSLTIFTAADLVPALRALIPDFEKSHQAQVVVVPGSTGTLTQQIRNGAPADLFFAANQASVDDLASAGLTLPGTNVIYARGRLALATLSSGVRHVTRLNELADPAIHRIAIANPGHAPYGLAAQQALQAAGLWEAVRPKLVYGENIQQAVQFVQSGSADVGIVARSLADRPELRWTLVDTALYAPISQSAVVLKRSRQPDLASAFLAFVRGSRGHAVLKEFGFLLPGEDF